MTQLIIAGITLPQTSRDRYSCYPAELESQLDMISGRRVVEQRGKVQMITWSYDYLPDELCRPLLNVLRSGGSFEVQYLPDDGDQLVTGQFLKESLTSPTFAFAKGNKPFWHNLAFTLREVKPHD